MLTRVSAFIAFFPLFSRRQLPSLVKFGLAAALSIFWVGEVQTQISSQQVESIGAVFGAILIAKEILIGLVLAICLGLFFWPARVAGAYVGQELGLSLASISDPGSQDSSTLVTRIFESFATLVFFGLNLHHLLVLVLHISFQHLTTKVHVSLPAEELTIMLNKVSDHGLMIAAPFVLVFMLVTLVLALLNRAAPTLNLFSIGMSLRAGLGVFCLFVFSPILLHAIQHYLYRVQMDIEDLLRMLG